MIWVVDSDPVMAECIARAARDEAQVYYNAIDAIGGLAEGVPELIFLEVMLAGPDGFTLLNELRSYEDTMRVPVVLVSERDFAGQNLAAYGVVGVLLKDTMRPEQIRRYVEKFTGVREEISA